MANKPFYLTLTVRGRNIRLSVTEALTGAWYILTYPLAIAFGYYMFGWVGALWVVGMQIFNFRGRL